MHLHNVTPEEIKKWAMQNAYQMDSPGVLVLQEQTSVIRDWNEEPYKSDLKFCLASPVEYASVVSNLGMAILYQEINQDGKHPTTSGVLCERAYFPEKKLLTRLEKKGWPLFSKETFVPLCNFEVLAFSSYYPLQYFNVPRMLEMSSIPAWAKDRDGKNAPIIMGGGISFFNPEPVSDFFDCFFIGEGEEKLLHVLQIAKECRTEEGIDKEKYLYRLAKETDYMYVPSFYDVKYFSGFGVKSRTSKIPEAKPIIRRALANIYDIKPLTRTFVPVCDSADMSISSVEISRGKCASSSVVDTAEGLVGLGTITKSNHPYALKGGSVRPIVCLDVVNYPAIEGETLLRIRTAKGNEIIVSKDHPVLINGEYVPAVQIKKGNLIGTIRHKDTSEIQDYKDVSDAEIRLVAALIADGTLAISKHSVFLSKKTPDPIKFVADQMSILGIKYSILSSEGDYRIYTKTFDSREDSEILSPADREAAWQKSTIYRILTKWNLLSKKSGNKVFPQFVSLFSDRQVSILLNTLISFDGSICLADGSRGFNLGSKSREQCLYIKNLLTRFGIVSKVPFEMNGGAYQVQIRNFTFDNLDLALEFFKPMMWQEDKWRTLFVLNSQKDRNLLSVDVVPYKAWTYFEQLKKDLNLTWEKINEELISYPSPNNIPRKKSRTGERVSRAFILKAFNSKCFNKYVHSNSNVISMLSGDIYWDTVISVDETPSVPCTDITTECPVHSFNINGVLVHNCSASCNFCLDKDQEVETTRGVKKISDITEQDRLISVYSADSYESFVPKAVSTLGAVCTGYKDVYEFRVNNRAIRATEDHPVITLDGDTIPIKEAFDKKIPLMPISQVKSNLYFDVDAFMVAVIGADFCLTEAAKYPCFCQSESRPLPAWLIANTRPNTKSVSKGSIFLRYTDHPVATLARDVYGVCESKNKNPQFELKDINAASSFVFGLLATDVSVRNNPKGSQIIFGSVSKHLNDFIGVALTFAGIPYYKSKKHDRYVCTISSAAGINRIYHILEQYKGILDLGLTLPKPTDTQRKIYITSCEHVGKSEVYDLTVPNVHTYCVNGFVVHNCEGSARTMPLRERPLDVSLKAFDEVHKETGCFDTTPYGFNLSDHSNIRAMLNYLAKDQDVKIQMSSQRIDMFTEDFASLAYATGNRSVTLAIEGGSERMRRAVNKNLTTQQILEAFEIALKIGFSRVKIYMIANLPFERSEDIDGTPSQLVSTEYEGAVKYHEEDAVYLTFEDNTSLLVSKNYVFYKKLGETTADQLQTGDEVYVDETLKKVKATERREADLYGPEKNEEDSLVGLMKKLAARRDYWKQQHGGKETVLNWSFTPFTSKNSTPFQFASCMGGLTNRKTLTPAVEAARQLGFKFRVGTAADVSTVAQVMTLGDRRLNNVIYRAYKEGIIQYFGGMGIGKDVLPAFENLLKEEVGHTYDVYGGEKMLHQIFPWDFIDVGMDKTHLKERYLQAKAATNSPFGCFNRCVSCGACMVDAYHLPKTPSGKEYRPFIWRKEVCTGDTLDNVNLIIKSAKKQDVARYILKVDVFDENMRYLNAKKMKLYINRAFFRVGFPARKRKVFLSDKFKYKNYSYGIDYCIGQLTERPTISSEELVEKFNEHLVPFGIRAERLEIYSMATKAADISEFFMSEIQTDFDISKVKSAIEEFLASDSCIVKVKQQGMMRDSWVTVDVDARPHVKDIWAEQLNGVTIIRMISEAPVSFYQLLPAILKTSQKNIMRFPVRRLEYFKLEDEGALDFFDETCEVSGKTIEKNPFDEQISDRFCARYLPFDSALATFGGEFTEEDEKADEEAEAIEAPAGQALSPEHDIVDIEGEGDEFESDESDQDNE